MAPIYNVVLNGFSELIDKDLRSFDGVIEQVSEGNSVVFDWRDVVSEDLMEVGERLIYVLFI